jgi:hypothetical protein
MEEPIATSLRSEVATYVGIDWADQKHDVVRSLSPSGPILFADSQVLYLRRWAKARP